MMLIVFLFFIMQKTAYEMRISDWSSDVCSSDLLAGERLQLRFERIDARGQVDHRGVGARAFAGGVVGRDLAFEKGRAAAREDRTLDRPHFLFEQIGRASCRERVCQSV